MVQPATSYEVVEGIIQSPYQIKTSHGASSDESEEEGDGDYNVWLDYREMAAGDNTVHSRQPKLTKVTIEDASKQRHICNGHFPLTQVYWHISVGIHRNWLKTAPVYTIRSNVGPASKHLVMLFLSDCLQPLPPHESNGTKACFDAFCARAAASGGPDFCGLEQLLQQYMREERSGCCLHTSSYAPIEQSIKDEHNVELTKHHRFISSHVFGSELGMTVLRSAKYPHLVQTLCQLLPHSFKAFLLKLKESDLPAANLMAQETPWEFAFREIISAKIHVWGVEASLSVYQRADYFSKTPQRERDAMVIYEMLKIDSKKHGNTYMSRRKLLRENKLLQPDCRISGEQCWSDALEYLQNHSIIECNCFHCEDVIFLRCNSQAEMDIVLGLRRILTDYTKKPLKWDVDFTDPEFSDVCRDEDQLRASQVISSLPITVLSGRGGCGKTTVVTKLLRHLCQRELLQDNAEENTADQEEVKNEGNAKQAANSLPVSSECLRSCPITAGKKEEEEVPGDVKPKKEDLRHKVVEDLVKILLTTKDKDTPEMKALKEQILLTAPTGKAARLLGCKAKLPSATLHSVIVSWKMYSQGRKKKKLAHQQPCDQRGRRDDRQHKLEEKEDARKKEETHDAPEKPWKYSTVQVLVVDECSLVSVRLFANILNTLLNQAQLRKVILLGDIHQLPSVEPGNFLLDMFKSLTNLKGHFGFSMELTHNHRSESDLIVGNSRRIAMQQMPVFDPEQKFHFIQISEDGDDNERDRVIRDLLNENKDMKSQVHCQFVTFRNAHCKAVNELCCCHYNHHSIVSPSQSGKRERFCFEVGDKICLSKNKLVHNHRQMLLDLYIDFPAFREALGEASRRREEQKRCPDSSVERDSAPTVPNQSIPTILDRTSAVGLITGNDEVYADNLDGMVASGSAMGEATSEWRRQQRLLRAKSKSSAWKAKEEQTRISEATQVQKTSLLGQVEEKLCNGEVFFIMDEKIIIDETGRSSRYLVLSDCDSDLPRVMCVSARELQRHCGMKHSWVRTIHTYQGSESDTVVYVLGEAIPQNWQHVYTAVTRGKKAVYVVGKRSQLQIAITRRAPVRYTYLGHLLKDMVKECREHIEICQKNFCKSIQAYQCAVSPRSQEEGSFTDADTSWLHALSDPLLEFSDVLHRPYGKEAECKAVDMEDNVSFPQARSNLHNQKKDEINCTEALCPTIGDEEVDGVDFSELEDLSLLFDCDDEGDKIKQSVQLATNSSAKYNISISSQTSSTSQEYSVKPPIPQDSTGSLMKHQTFAPALKPNNMRTHITKPDNSVVINECSTLPKSTSYLNSKQEVGFCYSQTAGTDSIPNTSQLSLQPDQIVDTSQKQEERKMAANCPISAVPVSTTDLNAKRNICGVPHHQENTSPNKVKKLNESASLVNTPFAKSFSESLIFDDGDDEWLVRNSTQEAISAQKHPKARRKL